MHRSAPCSPAPGPRAAGGAALALAAALGGMVPAASDGTARSLAGPGHAPAATRDAGALRAGRLLVASTTLGDPNFDHTVVLLVAHGDGGTHGLIVNRPMSVPLSLAVPELTGPGAGARLYEGGPVSRNTVSLVVRSDRPLAATRQFAGELHFSRSREVLDRVVAEDGPDFRAYAGHAGWAPGQLEAEIERGDWFVTGAGAARAIFETDPDGLWHALAPPDPTRRAGRGPAAPLALAQGGG